MKDIDKYRGCLIGGAAGDALGYAIEFCKEGSIFREYGEKGITEYELIDGVAQISDDTQMTLFTANGLLLGKTENITRGIAGSYPYYVSCCYKDWLRTQEEKYPIKHKKSDTYSWLVNIPEFFNMRAPGNTCLSAIHLGAHGTIKDPVNNSKGCGGVMRVAPVGLYFGPDSLNSEEADMIGAEIAAITHGHELGYIPAASLTHIIRCVVHENMNIEDAVLSALKSAETMFKSAESLQYYLGLMEKAIALSKEELDDLDAIHALGKGWVAEEALAIAVYCALKYPDDIDKALIAAVNHEGDSDSTGAVAGNIVGANVGLNGIPEKYTKNLELFDTIISIADDLYNDCNIEEYGDHKDPVWESKYIYHTYPEIKEFD